MGLSKGSCVNTYASEDVLQTCVMGLVTAFALAFVDDGAHSARLLVVFSSSIALLLASVFLSTATYREREDTSLHIRNDLLRH